MERGHDQSVIAQVTPERCEVSIRFPGAPSQFVARLERVAGYLAVLSDREFREVGQAVLDALGPARGDATAN